MRKSNWLSALTVLVTALVFSFSGCNIANPVNEAAQFGSLTVNGEGDDSSRAFYTDGIKSAVATVTGYDNSGEKFTRTSKPVAVSGGTASGITINNIPYSKNAAVTVQAYSDDAGTSKINGVTIYNIVDIGSAAQTVKVNQSTSATGCVYAQLIAAGVNTNAFTTDKKTAVSNAIPDVKFSLVNAASLVTDHKAGSLKDKSNYVYSPAAVTVTPDNVSGFTVQISDPNSEILQMGTSAVTYSVTPGSWTIYAIDSDGTVKATKGITVSNGGTASVTVKKSEAGSEVTDKIVVHVPSALNYSNVHYWGGDVSTATTWPGDSTTEKDDDGNLVFTIPATKAQIIFNGTGTDEGKQTEDLYLTEGEWTYTGGAGGTKDTDGSNIANNFTAVQGSSEEKVTITVDGGSEPDPDPTDSIIVHAQASSYKGIYVWDSGTTIDKTGPLAMTEESAVWYGYTINATSAKIIFTSAADSWDGKSGDLSRTAAGEYWYYNGSWYDYNPEDTEAPVLVSFTSDKTGTVSGDVTFTVSATDNLNLSKAVLATSTGTAIGTISLSGTSATGSYTWSTAKIQNGSYTINCTLSDAGGNSVSGTAITLTTNNENLPPVAVISGSKKPVCDKSVTYKATSSYDQNGGTIKSYAWTLTGSGASITSGASSDTLVVQTSKTEGATFTLSLTVTDNEGASSSAVTLDCTTTEVDADWDFRNETIYFLMTARWYDGDETNNRWCRPDADGTTGNVANNDPPWRGDFKGIVEKLDYIKAMGFSAIWITPPVLNRSDYDYHGYHAWNMNKIDKRLESDDMDYQDFIDACHAKGIKVIQDIVLNHSCRYGLEDLSSVKYYGSKSISWGNTKGSEYYNDYNPDFTYDGLSYEPNSGLNYYNGDLWQEDRPTLSWNPELGGQAAWGVKGGGDYYGYQWPGCIKPVLDIFNPTYYHQYWIGNWEGPDCQTGTIHEDCIDLNTENSEVQQYLIDAYSRYIEMGVDAFRIDTVKHINRVVFNRRFNPAFMQAAADAGNDKFFMFGECCTKVNDLWNHDNPSLSCPFYTWKETQTWSDDDETAASECYAANCTGGDSQPTSTNAFLNGNSYHTPDYTNKSDLSVIDFPMHMNFTDAGNAYNMRGGDKYYNDATWNVVYVESHDYSPDNGPANDHDARCTADDNEWAEDMALMWTFRGIPCLFQGSEIRFQSGVKIDAGTTMPLASTGRAYYGTNIEGTIEATDFGEWNTSTLSGNVKTTMEYPLVPHVARLNKIRRAIPALQKGQYSTDNCNASGMAAFKRRYTNTTTGTDSFVLVSLSGGATFTGLPAGTYVDVITGNSQTISEGGTVTATCSGQGNARIYVLQNSTATEYGATGKIGSDTKWLKL